MKRKLICSIAFAACLTGGLFPTQTVSAESNQVSGDANVTVQKGKTGLSMIQDPENPETEVDPGDSPRTDGDLRIDFVPQLNFSTAQLNGKDLVLPVNAQLFHSGTAPRGNFIQITDERDEPTGWTLQVRQEKQFTHNEKEGVQLKGAVISLDKAWTNSVVADKFSPTVQKEVIQMLAVGETYNLAKAEYEKGMGTWSIAFGASAENQNGQTATLDARKDAQGNAVMDTTFNQPSYLNSAVNLTIPGDSNNEPGAYSTVLTWILAELP